MLRRLLRAGWLLRVTFSPYCLALPSYPLVARLVVACRVASLCRHIVLRHPLVLLSHRLIVGCRVVALSCCAAL
jgi:hypothetical protein